MTTSPPGSVVGRFGGACFVRRVGENGFVDSDELAVADDASPHTGSAARVIASSRAARWRWSNIAARSNSNGWTRLKVRSRCPAL